MHKEIYDRLREVARNQTYTTYTDIALFANLDMSVVADRDKISGLLEDIARHEQAAGRPMLTAVVIHELDNLPGNGFFTIAQEFGRFDESDRLRFWIDALNEVHVFWRNKR